MAHVLVLIAVMVSGIAWLFKGNLIYLLEVTITKFAGKHA
jgi:hypothetical protein